MKTVLFQGAFEIVNYGHIRAFKHAKDQGDYLIVALNTNRLLREYKGRKAILPWSHKAYIIRSIRYVDKVVSADTFSPFPLLKKYRPDVYVCGSEWVKVHKKEIAFVRSYGGKVVITPRYNGVVPTSEIKRRLLAEARG